jgi:hypothetical protein
VNDTVVMAVHAVLEVLVVEGLFLVADEVRQVLVAGVEAVRDVPVVVGGRRLGCRRRARPRIRDETEADEENDDDDRREEGPALEADLLAFALAGQSGDSLGRRCFTHEDARLPAEGLNRPFQRP